MIPARTICPNCGESELTRIERVIQGTQMLLSYYCGGCEHVWQTADSITTFRPPAKPSAPKRRPR
jgi:hypothetical protein